MKIKVGKTLAWIGLVIVCFVMVSIFLLKIAVKSLGGPPYTAQVIETLKTQGDWAIKGLTWHNGFLYASASSHDTAVDAILKISTQDGEIVGKVVLPDFDKGGGNIQKRSGYGGLGSTGVNTIMHINEASPRSIEGFDPDNGNEILGSVTYIIDKRELSDITWHQGSVWVIAGNRDKGFPLGKTHKTDNRRPPLDSLYKINIKTGDPLRITNFIQKSPVLNYGLTSDGENVWVVRNDKLFCCNPFLEMITSSHMIDDAPEDLNGLAWDGENIWASARNGSIYKFKISLVPFWGKRSCYGRP